MAYYFSVSIFAVSICMPECVCANLWMWLLSVIRSIVHATNERIFKDSNIIRVYTIAAVRILILTICLQFIDNKNYKQYYLKKK